MSDDRKNRPATVEELARDVVRKLRDTLGMLSDAEWDARDAKVQAALAGEKALAAAARRDRVVAELVHRGLSERHVAEVLAGGLADTPALKAVRPLGERGTWVLVGNVGCGKTLAAHAWALRPLARVGRVVADFVAYRSAHEFARASRYSGKFDELEAPAKLVIDDLGVEFMDKSGSVQSDLDALLDARWRAGKGTLMTANLTAADFAKRYSERVADRVRSDGGFLSVAHPSMRKPAGERR